MSVDPFALERFMSAQRHQYDTVRAELAAGSKASHWMWYVFPQIAGLGYSEMSRRYAIKSRDEAVAFLHHPVLGPRLGEFARLVLEHDDKTAEQIFGGTDAMKFRSCMTLFSVGAPEQPVFSQALDRFFGGQPDVETLARL